MRSLYTLAYPSLLDADASFINEIRKRHDLAYIDVVAAHFTLVFGCSKVKDEVYLAHLESIAASAPSLEFSCRYVMLGSDDQDGTAYAFLVPDEGYSGLSLLHDRLYSGVLADFLRLDIPFIPHITIGTFSDRRAAKGLCDDLNRRGLDIHGRVRSITAGALQSNKIENLASFELRG